MTKLMTTIRLICILMVVTAISVSASEISYQGRLTDSEGIPLDGTSYEITFILFDDSLAGSIVWAETLSLTPIDGLIDHSLGSVNSLGDHIFRDNDRLYLEIRIDNEAVGPRRFLSQVPYAISSAELKGSDSSGITAFTTDNDNRKLTIYDESGEPYMVFQKAFKDSAVMLPDFSINSKEILDEPGVANSIDINLKTLSTGEMSDLAEVSILTPNDGYIMVTGKCYLLLSGTTGANTAIVQIDENEGGGTQFPYFTIAGLSGYTNSGTNYFPVYVHRVYYKKRGVYTFRLEGRASYPSPAIAQSWDHIISAVYLPTGYTTVSSIAPTPSGDPMAEPIIIDGSDRNHPAGTYYKIDFERIRIYQDSLLQTENK